jgi:hypothetical protein
VRGLRGGAHGEAGEPWRGFWATIALILESLGGKLAGRPWLAAVSRQRQQYWWHGFQRQRRVEGAPVSLSALSTQKIIVATHSMRYRRMKPLRYDPHRIFAATTATAMS